MKNNLKITRDRTNLTMSEKNRSNSVLDDCGWKEILDNKNSTLLWIYQQVSAKRLIRD